MQRQCAVCGAAFEARRSTARYCGGSCRARKSQGAKVLPLEGSDPGVVVGGVASATRVELELAGRVDSALGQAALVLASRVDSDRDTGSAAAALVREWRATLGEAVKGSAAVSSPLDRARDELAKRRAARGA